MKHFIVTRLWFDSIDLLDKYLDVSVNTFVPALKSQTCKDFELILLVRSVHVEHVREKLGIEFTAFTKGIKELRDNLANIQTRLDIDDWVSPDYVERIQKIYKESEYNDFVIHTQPERMNYPSGKCIKIPAYHDKRISMFASLCQKNPDVCIYDCSHSALFNYAEKVYKMPDGMARWVQHRDTVSNTKSRNKGTVKVGSMITTDKKHNWIEEKTVLNVLTRTFKRSNSFKVCRESVMGQTYSNINHIVGSEVECDYHDAILLSQKTGKDLPWNLHLNDLGEKVTDGWVMYLDDDDKFLTPDAVSDIMAEATDEDTMLLWRVRIGKNIVPNDQCFGSIIKKGQISGIGVAFHSKHLPVPWLAHKCGDYHIINYLAKTLKVKWINKVFTGTQGLRNHHGSIPSCEIPQKQSNTQKGLVTVGTPVWNNSNIFWLSIESLCRQKTDYPWEYIVSECPSANNIGEEGIREYEQRLRDAGCVRIVYINNGSRINLSTKWKRIADIAQGEVLILHDSDDYTHPGRIQRTMELIGDKPWYETRFAWHYLIGKNKMLRYDPQLTGNSWKTGFNIAIKTDKLRAIPDIHRGKGMHTWMLSYLDDKFVDQEEYACIATTGANTVSFNRVRHFDQPSAPFQKTDQTLESIGIPDDIINRLVSVRIGSAIEKHRNMAKIEVEFTKSYCRLYKEGDIKRIPVEAYYNLLNKGHVRAVNEEINKPVTVEL